MLNMDRLAALHAVANQGSIRRRPSAARDDFGRVAADREARRETDQILLERVGRGVRLTDAARCSSRTRIR
jgi:hypothetical protein